MLGMRFRAEALPCSKLPASLLTIQCSPRQSHLLRVLASPLIESVLSVGALDSKQRNVARVPVRVDAPV